MSTSEPFSTQAAPQKHPNQWSATLGVLFILFLFIAAIYGCVSFFFNSPFEKAKPSMVRLADGQTYFGALHGNTLCNYVTLSQVQDEKTKKTNIQVNKGGAAYGGTGCLTIKEPIAVIEEVTPTSPLYKQITGS